MFAFKNFKSHLKKKQKITLDIFSISKFLLNSEYCFSLSSTIIFASLANFSYSNLRFLIKLNNKKLKFKECFPDYCHKPSVSWGIGDDLWYLFINFSLTSYFFTICWLFSLRCSICEACWVSFSFPSFIS